MSTQRKKTKNELIVLDKVKVIDVYNDFVTPLNPKKYMPMSDERITSLCPFHVDTDPSLRYWKQRVFSTVSVVVSVVTLLKRTFNYEEYTTETI